MKKARHAMLRRMGFDKRQRRRIVRRIDVLSRDIAEWLER